MVVCFFDVHEIVHNEFVPPHHTVTTKFYLEVLGRLRVWIMRVRIMTSRTMRIFGFKRNPTLPHTPYSPNFSPGDFFLFAKLKSVLKGKRFDDLEEIKANTTRVLKALTSSDFKSCFKSRERRWNKCVILGGLQCGYWGLVCVKLLNLIF